MAEALQTSMRAEPRQATWWRKLARRRTPYLMLAPAVLILLGLTLYPTLYMVYISFHEWAIIATIPRQFIGFGQYTFIARDPQFWNSLRVTVIFLVVAVFVELALGFGVAALLRTDRREIRALRSFFLIPTMMAPVVVGLIWRFMLQADLGIANYFLRSIGLPEMSWLGRPWPALASIMLVDIWQWTPFMILILLAGMESLPAEPFEAAYVDGASRWQALRYITLPLLTPVIAIALLFRTLDAFKTFDIVYIVTRGGPAHATNVLSYGVWRKGFFENQLGYAAALSVLMIIIVTVITNVYARFLSRSQGVAGK